MTLPIDSRLRGAHEHARRGEVLQAERLYLEVLKDWPGQADAAHALGMLAAQRADWQRAVAFYEQAQVSRPNDSAIQIELAQVLWQVERADSAVAVLRRSLEAEPGQSLAWLLLGEILEAQGDTLGSTKARYQAIWRAQKAGRWTDIRTTEPALLDRVMHGIQQMHANRRAHLLASFDVHRRAHGAAAVQRVEKALLGYLGEIDTTPPDPRQRPKFLYVPGLPDLPYHDPFLQPWAGRLRDNWTDLRDEARSLLGNGQNFESFLGLKPGEVKPDYIGGDGRNPAWDAFFFYRHGQRFEDHHARCPKSSALLESIELCRVENQAPEVCFSVLQPGTHIKAHHGVTNSRLVMHLPLVVPPQCALNIVGVGEHVWREAELMMFDDTFQHEAWNRSDQVRVILLMDCWNPHLTPVERVAVKDLVEAIDRFEKP